MTNRSNNKESLVRLLRRSSKMGLGSILSQGVLIVSAPLLARLYGPESMGIAQLILSIGGVFWLICCLRYEQAIVLPNRDDAWRLLVSSLLICAFFTIFISLVLLFFSGWIATSIGLTEQNLLWTIPVTVLLAGIYQTGRMALVRLGLFGAIGISLFVQSLVCVSWQLWWGDTSEAFHLLLGVAIGYAASAIVVFGVPKIYSLRPAQDSFSWQKYKDVLVRYKNFPIYTAPYAFISQFSRKAIFILLGIYISQEAVGLCALAQKLTYIPVSVITLALGHAFYHEAVFENDKRALSERALSLISLLLTISMPVVILFILSGDYIIRTLLGPEWGGLMPYIYWQIPPAITLLISNWLDRVYDVNNRQKLATQLELVFDIILLLGLWIILWYGASAIVGVAFYSTLSAIYNLIWLFITFKIAGFNTKVLLQVVSIKCTTIILVSCATLLLYTSSGLASAISGASIILGILGINYVRHQKWDLNEGRK